MSARIFSSSGSASRRSTRPRRILIVTSGPLCRNPRALKEAQALGAASYEVLVLTVANQERYEAYDREILRSAPFAKEVVSHLPGRWVTRARAVRDRAITWAARRALRLGWQSPSAFGPCRRLCRRALALRADLTIVHTELGLAVGAHLLRRGRRVAADFEDWHSRDLLPSAQRGRPLGLLRRCEGLLLRQAAFATTTSAVMAQALAAANRAPVPRVIRNVFPLQPDPAVPDSPIPSFFWFSQTVGPGRMLELFLAAWTRTRRPSRVCLLGELLPGYGEKLLRRLPEDRRSLVSFADVVPPWDLPAAIARHDIGLALESAVPESRNLTITNKIFQYLNAGLAVVASSTAGQREALAEAPGAGWIADPTQTTELAAGLDDLIASPEKRRAMGAAARKSAQDRFCWEKESPRLLEAVASALAP